MRIERVQDVIHEGVHNVGMDVVLDVQETVCTGVGIVDDIIPYIDAVSDQGGRGIQVAFRVEIKVDDVVAEGCENSLEGGWADGIGRSGMQLVLPGPEKGRWW